MNAIDSNVHNARIALACLDLTSLNDVDDEATIDALCARAVGPQGAVAAVCVWPRFVAHAKVRVPAGVRVAAVANFPHGALDSDAAVRDAHAIVAAGGDEIDLVLPYHAWLAGEHLACAALVAAVRRATAGHTLKLIVESGELRSEAAIRSACVMGLDEGVDFLKTSTGKTPVSATPAAARTMLEAISSHSRGHAAGFKASGGIRTLADAQTYIALVHEHLGADALTPLRFRIGASSLLGDIARVLGAAPPGTDASSQTY